MKMHYYLIIFSLSCYVYITIRDSVGIVMDEVFHLDQAKNYYDLNIKVWNQKLTTFPLTFIITSLYWKILDLLDLPLCHYRYLIFIYSLIFLYIANKFTQKFYFKNNNSNVVLILYFLPINYFFYFIYYTETLSLLCVVLYFYYLLFVSNFNLNYDVKRLKNFNITKESDNVLVNERTLYIKKEYNTETLEEPCLKNWDYKLIILGLCCVLARQNNIIWINYFSLLYTLMNSNKLISRNSFYFIINTIIKFKEIVLIDVMFVLFLIYNDFSMVLGDKSSHSLVFHLAQINHFMTVLLVFLPTLNLNLISVINFNDFTKNINKEKCSQYSNNLKFVVIFGCITLFLIISDYYSHQHLYILSDNRHYSFYYFSKIVNNKILNTIRIVYLGVLYSIIIFKYFLNCSYYEYNIYLAYLICLFLVLTPAKLFDFRYYSLPITLLILLSGYIYNKFYLSIINKENLICMIIINLISIYWFVYRIFENKYFNNELSRFMW